MKKLFNPNFAYIATFTLPFVVYMLGWSTIYPDLKLNLLIFYILTFTFCFFTGLLINKAGAFKYHPIPEYKYNFGWIVFLVSFYIVDSAYVGFVPLFSFGSGDMNYGGSILYGIPTVHVIMVTFTDFYALFLFHQYLSTRKLRLLIYFLIILLIFVALLQRSNIMYIFIGAFVLVMMSLKKNVGRKLVLISFFGLFTLYLFGYLGNLRSGKGDSTFIPRASGVTKDFLDSWVPNEFYWGYLYIASPVANLQNNIDKETRPTNDVGGLVVHEMLPDFITKKLAPALHIERRFFHQVNRFLNVGTIYARPYSFLSWSGMSIMFLYLMFLMNVYYIIIQKSYIYGITGIAMMFNVIALANFENTLWFFPYSLQLIFPILFSMYRHSTLKNIKDTEINPLNIPQPSLANEHPV